MLADLEFEKPPNTARTPSTFDAIVNGLVPGGVGGTCAVLVGHPMDMIKVRTQCLATCDSGKIVRPTGGTFAQISNIFAKEGVKGLYRGLTPPLLSVTPSYALGFWTYELGKNAICTHTRIDRTNLSIPQHALAGGLTGIATTVVLGPSERIKCLMQTNSKYRGFLDCTIQTFRGGGISSLLKGSRVTLFRDVPGNAAYFSLYEYSTRTLRESHGDRNWYVTLLCSIVGGGAAGMANCIVGCPADVVKSRFQTAPEGMYSGGLDVLKELWKAEGVLGLYRGIGPALFRAVPANAACFFGVEVARSWIGIDR